MRILSKVVRLNIFSILVSLLVSVQIIQPTQLNAVPTQGSIRTNLNAGVQFATQNTALTTSFTIEAWWKWANGVSPAFGQLLLGGSGTPGIYMTGNNSLKLTRWGGGYDSPDCTLQNSFVTGSWYHLAIGRSSGGLVTVWVNGSPLQNCSKMTVAPFTDLGTQFPSFFGGNGAGTLFDGYFANYRATSTDIYGAADALGFQPNSNFYTAIPGTINLLNTPNDNATAFSDSIGTPSGFTSHAGGTLSSEYPIYTPQSICFDGTQTKYFNTETIGTGDFTAELWVKPTATVRYESFLDLGLNNYGAYLGYIGDNSTRIMFYDNGVDSGYTTVPLNSWTHVAIVRSSNVLKMYIAGQLINTTTNHTKNYSYDRVYIGSYNKSVANYIGCMASVRVVKSAVYLANFTPASVGSFAALPNATTPLVSLLAGGSALYNSGTAGSVQGTGTLTYEALRIQQSTLTMNAASGTYGSTTILGTTGGSGTGAVSYTVVSGNCSVSGDVLSSTSAGNCVLTATKAADATYNAITSAQVTVSIAKKTLVFPFTIASNTGEFKYGATYTVSMTFPADALAGIGAWNVFKASTAYGINGAGDQICTGATVTAAGAYTCSFNSANMYPTAQAIAISGLHVRFDGSTNYNSFSHTTDGTKITISGCDYVFCPNTGAVTVTAANKTINFGAASGQLNHTISNGANGATTAWGVGCTSTYTTGAAVGTYPITCTSTSRPTGGPTPITSDWVAQNTNYAQLYNANVDNELYTLKNPVNAVCGTAAQWWVKCSFYTSDTYSNLSFVSGVLTVQKLTLSTPSTPTVSSITSSSIYVSFTSVAQASSHTVKVYENDGTTLREEFTNFISGSQITGLTAATGYKISVTAIGDGISTNSSTASSKSAATTLGIQANDLTITSISGTYGSDLTLVSTGGSGTGGLTYATSTLGCSLPTSTTLRVTGALTCQVSVTKAADATYGSATSGITNIVFAPKTLTITGLSGVNREFDGGLVSTVTGTATLSGIINSDVVTLLGTPSFAFASASVGDSKTVTASGYSLTGDHASKYGLTQPSVTANITKKSATVTATSSTIAVGSSYTPAFSTSGLAGSDSITAVTYSFSSTGTGTPPTTVGSATITPSAAIFGVLGAGDNYNLSYVTGTLDIVSSYLISFKSNFTSSDTSTVTVNFVPGDSPINQAAPTRSNFTFLGWFTSAIGGTKVNGGITPVADTTYWAHWIQNSLNGMGSSTKIGSITTDVQYLDTFTRTGDYGTVTISIPAGALPHQTLVDIYQVTDPTRANSLLVGSNYVLSLVVAWLAPDATVPTTQTGKPVTMTISNATIKKGAKVYAIVNDFVTLLGTATQDGSAEVRITDDPEVVIVLTKPDAPTGVSATSGGNATSTVSWTAPTSDGGSAVTGYTATSSGGQSCVSTTTSCSVSGLTNGTAYTFTVTATNAIGISDSSTASSPITPSAPAPAPAPTPTPAPSGGGGGGSVYVAPTPDPAIAIAEAAKAKAAAEKIAADAKAAADLKAAQDKAAAEAVQAAALKAAQELADAQAKADAELKAAQEKALEDARIAEELRMAQEKAEADLRAAAEKKAAEDAAAAALLAAKKIVPNVTLYSISTSLKLSTYDSSYLKKYVSKLKPTAKVTCVGYIYTKNTSYSKAKALASKQAKAVCAMIKAQKKTIVTSTVLYPSSKAPKAANGAKWVAVSYRVDGFKS
jgi:uncharacterized repeat protein (TIGR02543 family)